MSNSRRRISDNWGELMISDILELDCVDPTQMDKKSIHTLENIFDKLSSQELPNILEQEGHTIKKSLDEAIIKLKILS